MRVKKLPEITHAEVIRRLQREIEEIGSAQRLARQYGVSPRLMQAVMTGERNLSSKLLRAMKLRRITLIVHRYAPLRAGKRVIRVRKMAFDTERREAP